MGRPHSRQGPLEGQQVPGPRSLPWPGLASATHPVTSPLACPTLPASAVSAARPGSAASPFPPSGCVLGGEGGGRSVSGRGAGARGEVALLGVAPVGPGHRLQAVLTWSPDRARASGARAGGRRLSFPSSRRRDE